MPKDLKVKPNKLSRKMKKDQTEEERLIELEEKLKKNRKRKDKIKGRQVGEAVSGSVIGAIGAGGTAGAATTAAASLAAGWGLGVASAGFAIPVALLGVSGALIGTAVARENRIKKNREKRKKIKAEIAALKSNKTMTPTAKKSKQEKLKAQDKELGSLIKLQAEVNRKAGNKKVVKPT